MVGANLAANQNLKNAVFLRTEIENIDMHFAINEVDEIWLTFPDPQPKGRNIHRRLTSSRFLNLYKSILKKDSIIRIKTDSKLLFDYTIFSLQENDYIILSYSVDLYKSPLIIDHYNIITYYESRYLANNQPIYYLTIKPI